MKCIRPFALLSSFLIVGVVFTQTVFSQSASAKTLIFQSQDNNSPEKVPTVQPQNQAASNVSAPDKASVSVQSGATGSSELTGNSELFFMLEQLQLEVRQLRGKLEEQANQLHHLQRNSKSRYRDIDSRVLGLSKKVSNLEGSLNNTSSLSSAQGHLLPSSVMPAMTAVKAPVFSGSPSSDNVMVKSDESRLLPPTAEQKQAYQQAYSLIKEKKFDQAIEKMHEFIDKYPQGKLAGNAYYWLGEVYLVLPQLEQAKQAFSVVVRAFQGHGKVADALFKLGVCYDRLQEPAQSEKYLNEVQTRFPNSTAAKLAKSYKINR